MQVVGGDLVGVGHLARLGLGDPEAAAQGVDEQVRAHGHELASQLVGRAVPDGHLGAAVHPTGVELVDDLHHAHPGACVAGQDGPLDRGGAPPARQQREVKVDHGERGEHVGLDDAPERHHDAEVGAGAQDVVDVVADRQAQLEGRGLHRAGAQVTPATAALVGARHDQREVEACGHERAEGRHRRVRSAEEDEALGDPGGNRGLRH